MTKKLPPDIITVDELVAKSVFEKEFTNLKKDLENQQSLTWQVVIGVGIAFILAVGVIVVDSILSKSNYDDRTVTIEKEINQNSIDLNKIENQIDNLKIRNPYLK